MKNLYLFFALFLIHNCSFSQISLDEGDFPFAGFNKVYYEANSDSVDVGSVGTNQLFDFSKVLSNVYDTFNVELLHPDSTGFSAQHPTAKIAVLTESERDSATQQTIFQLWSFAGVSSQGAAYSGISILIDTAAMFNQAPPTSMIDLHAPYEPMYGIISATDVYPSSRTEKGAWVAQVGNLRHREDHLKEVEVDAYGKFKNPWVEFDALRLKVREITYGYDTVNGQLEDSYIDSTHYFEYWVKDFGYYVGRAYTSKDYSMIYDVEIADHRKPVGVEVLESNSILEFFPNPTNGLVHIAFKESTNGWIHCYNTNGQMILEMELNDSLGEEVCFPSSSPNGLYILRVNTQDNSYEEQIILNR